MFDVKYKIELFKKKGILRTLICLFIMYINILIKIKKKIDAIIFSIKNVFICTLKICVKVMLKMRTKLKSLEIHKERLRVKIENRIGMLDKCFKNGGKKEYV